MQQPITNKLNTIGHKGWSTPRSLGTALPKENYPWHIWTTTSADTSGTKHNYWMCAETWRVMPSGTDTPELAGDLINNQYVYFPVTGTAWAEISASTTVYLNVWKNDVDSLSGEVSTSAISTDLSANPITYAIELAHLYKVDDNIVVYQEQDVDITDVSVLGTSAQIFNHPYKTWLRYSDVTSGFEYGVSQIYADNVDIAGYIYSEDKTRYTVSGIPWTPISGDVNLFLNVTSIDISTATGYVSDAPVAVQLDPTSARTWPILIAEITNASAPNLMVRKYEDYHLASLSGSVGIDSEKYHPFLVSLAQTSAGDWQWNCNEQNDPVNIAGHLFNIDFTRFAVSGTDWATVSSGVTNVYCNITEDTSGNLLGAISTTPCPIEVSSFNYTYPYHIATLNSNGTDRPVKVQHYYDDIYIDTGIRNSNTEEGHPFLVSIKQDLGTSGYLWNCNEQNNPVSIAGHLFNIDFTRFAVMGTGWATVSSGVTNVYCNITEDMAGNLSGAISTTPCPIEVSSFDHTYPYHIATLSYDGTTACPVKVQHYYDDIYVRQDALITSGNIKENHPYKIWMYNTTSGYQWHCNEVNQPDQFAGYIYTNNMTRNSVLGTSLNNVSGDTEIYCNVTQMSRTEASGIIDTSAIAVSVTSGFPLTFPIHVADITFVDDVATVVQRYYDDIYTSYYETSAMAPSAVIDVYYNNLTGHTDYDPRHPYKTWLRSFTNISGNTEWEYAVSQFNAHLDTSIAGNVYPQDHVSKFEVTGIPWTSVSGDLDIYLNVKYASLYEASGWVTTNRIEDSNYLPNGQYNVLLSEIRFTSGDATCLNRKFEDEYVTVDNNDNFSFKVWLKKDVSGNNYWRCSEVSDNESTAGTLYSSNITPANVGGIDWTLLNDDEIVYCNVTQSSSGEASGYIDTAPISKSLGEYPCTFAVAIADITYNDGYPILVQRINNDIYTDNYIPTSGGTSNPESFGYKIWIRNGTSASFDYGVATNSPDITTNNYAGNYYTCTYGEGYVSRKDWTSVSTTGITDIYCNFSITGQTSWEGTISTSPVTNAPYSSPATIPVHIGFIQYLDNMPTVMQLHAGCIDFRGKFIPVSIPNFDSTKTQLFGCASNALTLLTLKDCPSG